LKEANEQSLQKLTEQRELIKVKDDGISDLEIELSKLKHNYKSEEKNKMEALLVNVEEKNRFVEILSSELKIERNKIKEFQIKIESLELQKIENEDDQQNIKKEHSLYLKTALVNIKDKLHTENLELKENLAQIKKSSSKEIEALKARIELLTSDLAKLTQHILELEEK
jgi:hypothetical protein